MFRIGKYRFTSLFVNNKTASVRVGLINDVTGHLSLVPSIISPEAPLIGAIRCRDMSELSVKSDSRTNNNNRQRVGRRKGCAPQGHGHGMVRYL